MVLAFLLGIATPFLLSTSYSGREKPLEVTIVGSSSLEVKSGTVQVITDTFASVVFATSFTSTPNVVCISEKDSTSRWDIQCNIRNVTVSGFDIMGDDRSSGGLLTLHWIATNAGNA